MTSEQLDQLLQAGIEAVQAGEKAHARSLLLQVIEQDDHIENAWYWLSVAVEDAEDKLLALENVLVLNPDHEVARSNLEWWRQRVKYETENRSARARAAATPSPEPASGSPLFAEDVPEPAASASPSVFDLSAAELAAADAGDTSFLAFDYGPGQQHATHHGDDGAYDPFQCIYCGYLATEHDRRCPDCGRKLVTRRARTRLASGTLKSARLVVAGITFLIAIETILIVSLAGLSESARQLAVSIGSSLVGYEFIFGDLGRLENQVLVGLIAASGVRLLLYIVAMVGLYARVNFSFYLGIFVLAADVLFSGYRATTGLMGFGLLIVVGALALFGLYLIFASEQDFDVSEERIHCKPDAAAKSAGELSRRGHEYSLAGKWGLAVAHFQAAVAAMPASMPFYKQLALGYTQIGRYQRALSALEEIRRRDPQDAEVSELMAMVKDQQAHDPKRGGEWWREV